jgi:O-antigen/teichoic acid export membrane protein
MTLSSKQELFCWLTGSLSAIALLVLSHTSYVTAATYRYGLALLFVVVLLFWFKFRRKPTPEPKWLRLVANSALVILSVVCLLYVLGVATWYK